MRCLRVRAWGSTAGVTVRSKIMVSSLTIAVTIDSFSYQSQTCDSNVKSRKRLVNSNQFKLYV